jgi:anaerobic magnesium-protoporphyrin IX monomethyl ester cyclase
LKVLLVAPPIMDFVGGRLQVVGVDAIRECPPLGIYSLAAVLEERGCEVVIADLVLHATGSLKQFEADLGNADLVGIGSTSMAWPSAVNVIGQIRRRRPDVPIVCGGIHPTLFDRYIFSTFPVQFVVRGEGEVAIVRLCEALEGRIGFADVPNLSWTNSTGRFVRNRIDPKLSVHDLESVPLPDFGRLAPDSYKCLAIESSRGCVYDCSFCSTPYRKTWRGLDSEAVVDRLERVLEHIGRTTSHCVHIVDDEFSMKPERATAIATSIRRRGLHPRVLFDSRAPDLLHPAFVPAIAPYTAGLLVGAECGYDEGLEKVGKGTTCATLESAARVLCENGIAAKADFSFILGLPWESREDVEKTIRFATHLFVKYGVHIMMQWYRQIPGSRIWDDARRDMLVHESMYDHYGFFRDLYLFKTACRLNPKEIYEIADMTDQLRWLAELPGRQRPSIVHHFPSPIADNFPRTTLDADDAGLANLRAIAHPPREGSLRLEGVRS